MKILVVDDHPIYRQGLALLLRQMDGSVTVEEAADCEAAIACALRDAVDLVILDLNLPGHRATSALEALRVALPDQQVVAISGDSAPALVYDAIERGASGFIPKTLSSADIMQALRQVLEGRVYLPPALVVADGAPRDAVLPELTPRQREVLEGVLRGLTNKAIARDLGVSAETVKTHLATAMRLLGARNRTELVVFAARRGLPLR